MQAPRRLTLGRLCLALATFALGVAGVVVATDGVQFPGGGQSVSLASAVDVGCLAVGPYQAPEQTSVGLPAGVALCPSGPMTVTTPGKVIDGWDVRGGIVVDAPGVVVRRSRITGDGTAPYGIRTTPAGSVRIEDTTLTGDFPIAAVGDDRWTGERVDITGVTHDGARLGAAARLRNSRLHDFAPSKGVRPDALVLVGASGEILVEDNKVEMQPSDGAAVRVAAVGRSAANVVIRGNVLGGGRYTVHEDAAAGSMSEVWLENNRFRRDATQGPLRVSRRVVQVDNTFVDGGRLPGE
jgi:hypothetical protein